MFGSKSKVFFTIALILMFVTLVFALFFMTQYANIHVFYNKKTIDGVKTILINPGSQLDIKGKIFENTQLFSYLRTSYNYPESIGTFGRTDDEIGAFLNVVYKFQMSASKFNDLIIIYFLVGLICVGILYLFDNHKRNTYYLDNVIVGAISSFTMIVFSVFMIVENLSLLTNFENNKVLYKIVSVMQKDSIQKIEKYGMISSQTEVAEHADVAAEKYSNILSKASGVNNTTFVIGIILFSLVAAYFAFIFIFTLLKYKATSQARKATIERAVNAND